MEAVAAARNWWAAWWRRPAAQPLRSLLGAAAPTYMAYAMLALVAGVLACAAFGYGVTQSNDSRMAAERHIALQRALEEFHAVFGDVERLDESQVRLLQSRTGLSDLRFEAEPVDNAAREVQSLHDRDGRITGWLSWVPDRALVRSMFGLWWLAGTVAAAISILAILLAMSAMRLARALARSEETVRKLTTEDELTGLPNQRAMLERLKQALARRTAGYVAFAVVDLDGFREVNDTLGRAGGDGMLARIAERLTASLPPGAQCGRYEDDQFAFIATGADAGTVDRLAGAIRIALARPFFMNQTWQIGASIGLAEAPGDGRTAEDLARRAGLALRAAQKKGHGLTRRFEAQIETDDHDRRFILRELKSAIATHAFDVHYQPVVAADGSGAVGVEALLRWKHAVRGSIPPSVFIPIAEQNGFMPQLGEFVLRRALADAARWPKLFIAVNLSPMQLRDRGLIDLVGAVMAENGIASSRVVLEVTEGVLIDDPDEAKRRLEALRALGVRIALDDFGAGYSSLSYLQQFPFDRLKIDRAFVASLGASGDAGAIIHSIVTLGHALGMTVLAEGIETDEQRVLLRLAGCDEMQGFLFARPAPAEAIDRFLAQTSEPQAAAPGR
jgi:diguanylate cyclase (GGDEF)-like protein